jgi:hypothetical protein
VGHLFYWPHNIPAGYSGQSPLLGIIQICKIKINNKIDQEYSLAKATFIRSHIIALYLNLHPPKL